MVSRVVFLGLRAAQIVLAIIVLGTAAYVVNAFSGCGYDGLGDEICVSPPSSYSFIVFVAVWSILVAIFQLLSERLGERIAHPWLCFGLDLVTTIFWFAGAIAIAVFTGAADLKNTFYNTMQACVAFAFFSWAAFLATTVLIGLTAFRGGQVKSSGPEAQAGI